MQVTTARAGFSLAIIDILLSKIFDPMIDN